MKLIITVDFESAKVTIEVAGVDAIATEALGESAQKTLADFPEAVADAVGDYRRLRDRAAAAVMGAENRNPHHCQRCERPRRQRSPQRAWRCRDCEFEESWED